MEPYPSPLFDAGDDAADLGLQFGQHGGIVGAYVQAEMEGARHDRHPVRRGVGMKPAERAGHRHAFRVIRRPQRVQRHGEFRPGHRGIMAEPSRQPDMVVPALDPGVGKPEVAWDPGADRHRTAGFDQAWRLLDMQFHVCSKRCRIAEIACACPQRIRVGAARRHVICQRAAGVDPADLQRTIRQGAEAAAAADIRHREPHALLRSDSHHDDVASRRLVQRLQHGNRRQPSQDAGRPVEVATMRHRVQMRADHHRWCRTVAPRQRHVQIGRVVVGYLQPQRLGRSGDCRVRPLFPVAVGVTRHARLI